MAVFSFTSLIGKSQAFNAAGDILSLTGDAAGFRIAAGADNSLIVSDSDGNSATLTGVSFAQLTSSNFLLSASTSKFFVGDNTTATTNDDVAQAIGGALDLVALASSALEANNLIYGLGGADYIAIGGGNNVIFGGSGGVDTTDGSDTIVFSGAGATSGSNLVYGNAGNDTFLFTDPTGAGKITTVYGGLGDDDFVTGAASGELHLFGNAGSDTINGSGASGAMTVFGGNGGVDTTDGADVIISGLGNADIYGNAGDDALSFDDFAAASTQHFYGGLGNDTLQGDIGGSGSLGTLELYGNAGLDTIDVTAHYGNVTVFGGNGTVDSTDGADSIFIGTGNGNHHATVFGNAGNDTITSAAALASSESLVIYAGVGTDVVNISGARAVGSTLTINGNEGNDTFSIDDSALTADATVTFGGFEATDKLQITLSGGDATTLVATGLGASVSFNNTAGNGNYVFTDYTGTFTSTNFVLSDGSVFLSNVGGKVGTLTGAAGNDQIIAGSNGDTASGNAGNDIITGGGGADNLTGGAGLDTIDGGEGNDTIDGGDDNDTLTGGNSADSIKGGLGDDSLSGGNGHDTLAGSAGIDTLTGGTENDTFQFAVAEVDAVDTNVDLVTDAFVGLDVFDFSDLSAAALRGDGTAFASGNGTSAQALGANVGLYVATNAAGGFTEANIYAALSGIADDLAASDSIYVMISNGTDARLVKITEAANPGTLVAADDTLEFVARLSGTTTATLATLVEGNFADFA